MNLLFFRIGLLSLWVLCAVALRTWGQQETNRPASLKPEPDLGRAWVDTTSGPFFTGTADVEPKGSFYIEPFYLNYRSASGKNTTIPWKFAYGIGHQTELDLYAPLEYLGVGGNSMPVLEYGDTLVQSKFQYHKETNRYRFLTMPSLGVSLDLNIPTGHLQSAKPNLAGGSQTTNNTWNEQFNILARKQFEPFDCTLRALRLSKTRLT